MSDRLSELARIPLFASLDANERAAIAELARSKWYAPGRRVFRQGDAGGPLFVVLSGYLKVVVPGADGNDVVFTIMGPGEVFGELSVLDGAPRSASIVTLAACEVVLIDREPFLVFLRSSPETAIKLLALLAGRIRRLSDEREQMVTLEASARLAKRLTELASVCGERSPDGELRISLRLSQRDLGAWIGATRESVNKYLRRWNRDGLLRFEAGHIFVRDVPALKSIACEGT